MMISGCAVEAYGVGLLERQAADRSETGSDQRGPRRSLPEQARSSRESAVTLPDSPRKCRVAREDRSDERQRDGILRSNFRSARARSDRRNNSPYV